MTVEKCLHVGSASEIALLPKSSRTLRGTFRYKSLSVSPYFLFKGKKLQPLIPSLSSKGQIQLLIRGVRVSRNKGEAVKRQWCSHPSSSRGFLSSSSVTRPHTQAKGDKLQAENRSVGPRLVRARRLMIETVGTAPRFFLIPSRSEEGYIPCRPIPKFCL